MHNRVQIIGMGYIGLPTAAVLTNYGFNVVGVDTNDSIVETINNGDVHILEPGLQDLVKNAVNSGMLKAVSKPVYAEIHIICVPTPINADGTPDLSYVKSACSSLSAVLKENDLIVLESTSPVGTTALLATWLYELRPDLSFSATESKSYHVHIAYCPERVLPGNAVKELIENDRIIGGLTAEAGDRAKEFYATFVSGNLHITDAKTAEMCKLVENSYRDVNIAFANELSMICDDLGIDVWGLIEAANKHPRVNILKPSPGVGGHCIAIDPWFIVSQSKEKAKLIATGRTVNDFKPFWVINKVNDCIGRLVKNSNELCDSSKLKIAFYGMSFKPNIDDLRESPAIKIISEFLENEFLSVMLVEPFISILPEHFPPNASLVDPKVAFDTADLHVFLVAHDLFKGWDLNERLVLDFCGLYQSNCLH